MVCISFLRIDWRPPSFLLRVDVRSLDIFTFEIGLIVGKVGVEFS